MLFLLALFGLKGCVIFDYSNLQFPATGSAAESIDEAETELYGDGPVELPVTMAKIDSPDVEKITIQSDALSFAVSSGFLNETGLFVGTGGYTLTVTGAANALNPSESGGLIAYTVDESSSVQTGSKTTATVSADGSFTLSIFVPDGYDVIIAAITSDEAYSSSYLRIVRELVADGGASKERFLIVTTNSATLNPLQKIAADGSGYYYLSTKTSESSHAFLRRNLDGTELQKLAEDVVEEVHHVSAVSEEKVAYVNSTGELKLILPSGESLSLVNPDSPAVEIVSYEKTLTTLTSYDADLTRIMMNPTEDGVFVNQFGVDYSGLSFVRTSSENVIPIIRPEWFEDVRAALSPGKDALYVVTDYEGLYSLSKISASENLPNAWGSRTTLVEDLNLSELYHMDASDNGVVVMDGLDDSSLPVLYLWDESGGLRQINAPQSDTHVHANPRISSDGSVVVVCRLGNAELGNQFAYYLPASDTAGNFHLITDQDAFDVCDDTTGSFAIDAKNFLHFYRSKTDGTDYQHGFFNLNQI